LQVTPRKSKPRAAGVLPIGTLFTMGSMDFSSHPHLHSTRSRDGFAVDAKGFVAVRADRFEKTVDHKIVFKRHAQFAADSAFDHCFFHDSQDQHLGDSGAAVFFDHAQSDETPFLGALFVAKQFNQTDR
jgi:hypothetical protein